MRRTRPATSPPPTRTDARQADARQAAADPRRDDPPDRRRVPDAVPPLRRGRHPRERPPAERGVRLGAGVPRVLRRQGHAEPARPAHPRRGRLRGRLLQPRGTGPLGAGRRRRRADHVHQQRHPGEGLRRGGPPRGDRQPRRPQPRRLPGEARRPAGAALLPLQPRPAAGGERHHRQAGGGQVRLHPRAALRGLRVPQEEGRAAVRPAHDGRQQRARPAVLRRDGPDAVRAGRGTRRQARRADRVRQPRRRHRQSPTGRGSRPSTTTRSARACRRPTTRSSAPPASTRSRSTRKTAAA